MAMKIRKPPPTTENNSRKVVGPSCSNQLLSATTTTSKAIPIRQQNHMHPTEAELLQEAEAIADYRDYNMYQLIVSGITRQQQERQHRHPVAAQHLENEETLRSIIRTRHSPAACYSSSPPTFRSNHEYKQAERIDDDAGDAFPYSQLMESFAPVKVLNSLASSPVRETEELQHQEGIFVMDL